MVAGRSALDSGGGDGTAAPRGLLGPGSLDRFAYDLRWRYAAGVDDQMPGFAHTVLVELRASADPDRIFRVTCKLAHEVGVRRVLDSAPLFDAVARLAG